MTDWGERLKQLRLHEGLTQTRVAHRMNVTQPRVSNIEASAVLESETIERYLDAMNHQYVMTMQSIKRV